MDENLNDQEVLLVKEPGDDRLKVVSGTDNEGNLKMDATSGEWAFRPDERSGTIYGAGDN